MKLFIDFVDVFRHLLVIMAKDVSCSLPGCILEFVHSLYSWQFAYHVTRLATESVVPRLCMHLYAYVHLIHPYYIHVV